MPASAMHRTHGARDGSEVGRDRLAQALKRIVDGGLEPQAGVRALKRHLLACTPLVLWQRRVG